MERKFQSIFNKNTKKKVLKNTHFLVFNQYYVLHFILIFNNLKLFI